MTSSVRTSSNGPTEEDLQRMYGHYSKMPVGDLNCAECGGSGCVQDGYSSGRCGCMPPFMVIDRDTGASRYGSLLLDGRMDGRPISRREAEHRHQEGVRLADETLAKMKRRWLNKTQPAASPSEGADVSCSPEEA